MSQVQPPLITNHAFSSWAEDVYKTTKEKAIVRSKELQVASSPFGSYIGLRPEQAYSPLFMNYRGEWNITRSYNISDVVRVLPKADPLDYYKSGLTWTEGPFNVNRTDGDFGVPGIPNGTPVVNGTFAGGQNGTNTYVSPYFVPIPGTYICVSNVPSFIDTYQLPVGLVPVAYHVSLTSLDPNIQANMNYIRWTNISYMPSWPERPNVAILDPSDIYNGYNGRYWELLSLLPTQTHVCSNGIDSVEWTDTQAVPSGSANYSGSLA